MEDTIRVALARWRDRQPNMASESFRNDLAQEIALLLREKGSYKEYTEYELDEQKARATWVCEVCGKNTYEVEYDYIGTGTNHLGCELEDEKRKGDRRTAIQDTNLLFQNDGHREPPYNSFVKNKEELEKSNDYVYSKDLQEGMRKAEELAQKGLEKGQQSIIKDGTELEKAIIKRKTTDRRKGDRREKNYSQEKHEDKVFGHDQGGNYVIPTTEDDGDDVAKALGHMNEGGNFITQAEEVDGMYFDDEVKGWEEAVGYVEPDNDTDTELRDKIFETQKQIYNEMTTDGLPPGGDTQAVLESRKLSEEIVDKMTKGYIYESPDGGKTIYQRKLGESKKTKLTNEEWKKIKNEKK